jgi:hypothetical protein
VVVSAVATIKGNPDTLGLESDNPTLTFDTASSQADQQFATIGGGATTKETKGQMFGDGFSARATKRVRCDTNRHFVVERHAYFSVHALNLRADSRTSSWR